MNHKYLPVPVVNRAVTLPPPFFFMARIIMFFIIFITSVLYVPFCIERLYAAGRQPFINDIDKTRSDFSGAGVKTYENTFYGFSIDYPVDFQTGVKRGGAVSIVPRKISGFRFIPALVVTKYFIAKTQPLKEIVELIEKKMSAFPYYRLNYIHYIDNSSEVKIGREFVDYASEETVYEIGLYKLKNDELYEISWQAPKTYSNSAVARSFEKIASSFRVLEKSETAEAAVGTPLDSPVKILEHSTSLIAEGRYLEAAALLKKIYLSYPPGAELYLLMARCHTGLKDYKRASAEYEKLLELYPANLDYLNLYVDSLVMSGNYKKALVNCRKALELSGPKTSMAMAYINLGNIFLGMKMLNEALNSYNEGITRFSSDSRLYNNAAYVCYLQRDYNSAVDYYNKAITLTPDYKNAHLGIAAIYMRKSNYTAAAFHYNKVIKIDEYCTEAFSGLLKVYSAMKMPVKYDELLKSVRTKGADFYNKVVNGGE